MASLGVDHGSQFRQSHMPPTGNLFERRPKCLLEADARLVARNDDRTFNDLRLHRSSLVFDEAVVVLAFRYLGRYRRTPHPAEQYLSRGESQRAYIRYF